MSKYVESQLGKDEKIIRKGKISYASLISIFFIRNIIAMSTTELAITNKNVVGKVGLIKTQTMSSPLNKVQNVSVSSGLFGKIFGYGNVKITTSSGDYCFRCISKPNDFKTALMSQIDQYEEDKISSQASQMASAMASAINK
ncbi:MAG: PH domain-containing protein [Clostridia bacterium]